MAKITTVTNPLTGQPAQVDQLDHTAQEIDDAVTRAIGYGLGGNSKNVTDWNNEKTNGWVRDSGGTEGKHSPFVGLFSVGLISDYSSGEDAFQLAFARDQFKKTRTYIKFRAYNSDDKVWGEWEWVNPPMKLGKEYRTTERYLGKPVYVKLVDCGALPNATYKDVQFAGSEARPISVSCMSGATACTATLPTMASGGAFGDGHKIDVSLVNYNQIRIVSDANKSGDIGYALVKYWKTTD